MSNQDWWPAQSTSQSYSTPSRPSSTGFNPLQSTHTPSFNSFNPSSSNQAYGQSSLTNSRARFAGDELDAEDLQRADNVKFYPTFASSPAGKLASSVGHTNLGSPGGVGKSNSPPARRSPQARFSVGGNAQSPNDASSPRAGRGGRSYPSPLSPEDEGPPTISLRDSSTNNPSSSLPTSSVLSPSTSDGPLLSVSPSPSYGPTSTKLHVFGPPLDQLPHLQPWLAEFGEIKSYAPGAAGANWFIVEYVSPISASYAMRRHGEIVGGKWMVGFKVASGGYDETAEVLPHNPGSRIEVQNKSVMKPKQPAHGGGKAGGDALAWDENEAPSGLINKAAEWLFGR